MLGPGLAYRVLGFVLDKAGLGIASTSFVPITVFATPGLMRVTNSRPGPPGSLGAAHEKSSSRQNRTSTLLEFYQGLFQVINNSLKSAHEHL
jgi:hypothetical protein